MSAHTMFILELILFDGVAVAWGVWEFWSVRPSRNTSDPAQKTGTGDRAASAEGAGHPEG